MSRLELLFLGPPEIRVDGSSVRLETRKAVALLAYLAVSSSSQRRDSLVNLLWPDYGQAQGRKVLRQALFHVHKKLGEGSLDAAKETIGLGGGAGIWCDIAEFRALLSESRRHDHAALERCSDCCGRLSRAAALYRDDFLAGFTLRNSVNFDDWQFAQTEALRRELIEGLDGLVRCLGRSGDYQEAIRAAQRWLAVDRLDESAHRALMRLYAWSDQRSAAIRQYAECVRVLHEEVDAPPMDSTTGLLEAIKSGRLPEPPVAPIGEAAGIPHPGRIASIKPAVHRNDGIAASLPAALSPLIGREREIELIHGALADESVRLVTLTGPGGIGKTRLALHAARDMVPRFDRGVFFVDLSPVTDPGVVTSVIAQALRIRAVGGRSVLEVIKSYLRDGHTLLVLDNFEQVMEAGLQILELVSACGGLKVMVTSREPLRAQGEKVLVVPPLRLPRLDGSSSLSIEELAGSESVRLFVERAASVRQGFALTEESGPSVARICIGLDGIPLAIELAAARVSLLSPESILKRLGHRLDLLTHGARDLAPRHKTLRAAIEWSFDLLDDECRSLFRSLSVFAGGFTMDAVENVCCASKEEDVLNGIESLLDKSLLYRDGDVSGEPRFHILETIREYGLERLNGSGDADSIRQKHCEYYCRFAEMAEPGLHGADVKCWLGRLEAEHDNLRESIRWCARNGRTEPLLRICGALWRFWEMRGYLTEGRERLGEALAIAEGCPLPLIARIHLGSCELAYYQSDYSSALESGERALALYGEINDVQGQAMAHYRLGWIHYRMDRPDRASEAFDKGHEAAATTGSKPLVGMIDIGLGSISWREGRTEEARRLFQGCLDIFEESGDLKHKAEALTNLGLIAKQRGDYEEAIAHYEQAAEIKEEIGEVVGLRVTYNNLGSVFLVTGEAGRAEAYYEKLEHLARLTDDDKYMTWAYAGLAEARLSSGNTGQAMADVRKSIRTAERIGQGVDLGIGYRVLGDVLLAEGEAAEAARYYDLSMPLLQAAEDATNLRKAQQGAGAARSRAGNTQ